MKILYLSLLILVTSAFFAGVIDAVVGGDEIIQIPALFAVYPVKLVAIVFGTNKCASMLGTLNTTWRYARQLKMPW